nr:hypothetical protein BaRGS_001849 [Batillaria attramentaria]
MPQELKQFYSNDDSRTRLPTHHHHHYHYNNNYNNNNNNNSDDDDYISTVDYNPESPVFVSSHHRKTLSVHFNNFDASRHCNNAENKTNISSNSINDNARNAVYKKYSHRSTDH